MPGFASSNDARHARPAPGDTVGARRQARVLFVNDTARNGGPGRSLHSILKFLDPAVVHRAVVLPRDGEVAELVRADRVVDELLFEPDLVENPIAPLGRAMERADFAAPSALKVARVAGNVAKVARGFRRLAALLRCERFDLVYCNGTNASFAGGALAAWTKVPALWHVRYSSLPRAVRGVHDAMSASAGVRRVVCVSRAAAALFPHCEHKVRVIHNALDVSAFDPAGVRPTLRSELGLPRDAVVFGSHGRVLRRKGYVEMVRAAKLAIARMRPDVAARVAFVVVGDTPQDFVVDHVDECRRLAAELGVAHRVHMLGFRPDVRPVVADFDVAVVPSVYADPLPRAVIESMALAKPVVAFAVGGVTELLESSDAGELVAFDGDGVGASEASIARLADAFVRYAEDAGLRARQGAAARERATRDFDARVHARRIQDEIVAAAGLEAPAP
jgi:glycosyltransferase involved in cell wall biosynthesis